MALLLPTTTTVLLTSLGRFSAKEVCSAGERGMSNRLGFLFVLAFWVINLGNFSIRSWSPHCFSPLVSAWTVLTATCTCTLTVNLILKLPNTANMEVPISFLVLGFFGGLVFFSKGLLFPFFCPTASFADCSLC